MYLFNRHKKGVDFAVKCDSEVVLAGLCKSNFNSSQLIFIFTPYIHCDVYFILWEVICEACVSLNMRRYHDDLLFLLCLGKKQGIMRFSGRRYMTSETYQVFIMFFLTIYDNIGRQLLKTIRQKVMKAEKHAHLFLSDI